MSKLLYVINSLRNAGAEKLIINLAIEMKNTHGLKVGILVFKKPSDFFIELLKKESIPLYYRNSLLYYSFLNLFLLIKVIKKFNYKLIHANLFPTLYLVSLLRFIIPKVKLIYTEHSTFNKRRRYFILKFLEYFVYSKYNVLIAISNGVKENLVRWVSPFSLPKNTKLIVILNGVFTEKYAKPENFPIKNFFDRSFILCMVGRFESSKNQELLIEILVKLPKEIKLLLVGDGKKKNLILKMIEKYNLNDRVKLLESTNKIQEIYWNVDLLVHAVNWEGFGLVVLEAMSSGLPIIASKVQGLQEVVGKNGILIPNNDQSKFIIYIMKFFQDSNFYSRGVEKSITQSKKFTFRKTTDKYFDVYISLLKGYY